VTTTERHRRRATTSCGAKTLGQSGIGLAADGTPTARSDTGDLDIWRATSAKPPAARGGECECGRLRTGNTGAADVGGGGWCLD